MNAKIHNCFVFVVDVAWNIEQIQNFVSKVSIDVFIKIEMRNERKMVGMFVCERSVHCAPFSFSFQ